MSQQATIANPPAVGETLDRHWLADYVGRKAAWLQRNLLDEKRRDHADAQATLARLRQGVGKLRRDNDGNVALSNVAPEVYEVSIGGFPEPAKVGANSMSPEEQASYLALTLFAVHQQSQPAPMHTTGRSFGAALGELHRRADEGRKKGIVRGFNALLTASSIDEISYHSRRLIALLRSAAIGFNYGQFAEDLRDALIPGRVDAVRLRWGRDFYRRPATAETTLDK